MRLEESDVLVKSPVMEAYEKDAAFRTQFFDYGLEQTDYELRLNELQQRAFQRKELANTIEQFMKPIGLSNQAQQHLDELRDQAVCVVGGQQAGLLTGPMYSFHKALSVIVLARKQRAALQHPVVPVFWVAGEDHDINEINHVYTQAGERITKQQVKDHFALKVMASDAMYNKHEMIAYIEQIFQTFGETSYTKNLYTQVIQAVKKGQTFTDLFVLLMNDLFASEGLLFIDSADERLRRLESPYFAQLIEHSSVLAEKVVQQENSYEAAGYKKPVEATEDGANLFYVHTTGRLLLTRRKHYFTHDGSGVRFTKEELVNIAQQAPEKLSNNVVTRPIMQDLVLPVLSFVGGPGEIAYWALLKPAFHYLQIKMPIISPRISLTVVNLSTQKALKKLGFSVEDALTGRVTSAREEFLLSLQDQSFDQSIDQINEQLQQAYTQLIKQIDSASVQQAVEQNRSYHDRQFNYVKERAQAARILEQDAVLQRYYLIEGQLSPLGQLQERVFTPYAYLNEYGPSLVQDLLQLPIEENGSHKVIYL